MLDFIVSGNINAEALSNAFSMNQKTFQRRLSLEGASYQKLLKKLRYRMATEMLNNNKFSVDEIASALCYKSKDSFSRAYREWTRSRLDIK